MLAAEQDSAVELGIELINRLAVGKIRRQRQHGLVTIVNLRRLLGVERQHGQVAFAIAPVAGGVEHAGAVRSQGAVARPQIAVQQRGLRLVILQALVNMADNGVDIAKGEPFFCRQLQLPADALFGKEG